VTPRDSGGVPPAGRLTLSPGETGGHGVPAPRSGAAAPPAGRVTTRGNAAAALGGLLRRRDALRVAGLAVAGALALPAGARAADEGALLSGLWRREMGAAFAYGRALAWVPQLAPVQAHEADHAAAVATELAAVGLGTPPPPKQPADLDVAAERLATARNRAEVMSAAEALEEGLVETYQMAVGVLQDANIAMTAATILASHAQHLLIVRRDAGKDPLAGH
jgi:Ferritin-like domain